MMTRGKRKRDKEGEREIEKEGEREGGKEGGRKGSFSYLLLHSYHILSSEKSLGVDRTCKSHTISFSGRLH